MKFNRKTWEQRKLGELVGIYDGVHQTPDYQDSGIMFLSVENIATLKSEKYISEEAFERDYKVYPEKDDILMTRIGDVGTTNVVETAEKVAFYVSLALLKPNGIDSYFLSNAMKTNAFQKGLRERTLVTAIPQKINKDEIGKIDIFITNNDEEQKKIGAYFSNLDHLITLHQRKCEQTKTLKKYMLQKMFPQEGQKVPEIRFEGFTGDWEQRKLGELGTVQTCKRIFKEQTSEKGDIPFFKNGTIGLEPDSYISREMYEEFRRLYPYPEVGDTLISVVGSIGRTAEYTGKDEYFQDSNVVWLKTDGSINKKFLKISYQVIKWLIEGSTVKHLYNDNILRSEIVMPVSQIEQAKIAEFFEALDNLITLHQRKCDETKRLKKYMLQKMFPQNGEKVPEIRFSGFTDDWEQRKFADFTWNAGKRNKEDLDLEPYAITNEHGFIRQRDAHDNFGYMKDTDRKAYNIVQPNSFAYNPARINVGSIGYYKGVENVIVSSLYEVFQTDNHVNDRFLWHWFKSDEFPRWIDKLQEGSVRLYFYYDKLCECQLYMPSLEEQEKIASFLDGLDTLITLHQRELENLQNIKKFMLEKMFV